jgi:hypothetical protein
MIIMATYTVALFLAWLAAHVVASSGSRVQLIVFTLVVLLFAGVVNVITKSDK